MKKGIVLCSFCIYFLNTGFSQGILLDPSFAIKGIAKTDMGLIFNYDNIGRQVLIAPDGGTYLVSSGKDLDYGNNVTNSPYPTTIMKLLPDGSADPLYGNSNLSMSVPIYNSRAVIQGDGKIVVAGITLNDQSITTENYRNFSDFAIARFNADGTLDNTFNGGNVEVIDVNYFDLHTAISIQSDGKIIIAGDASNDNSPPDLVLFRINPDGSLDNSFNESASITDDVTNSVATQSDGKIVVSGLVNGTPSLWRFNSNGDVDNTFNGTGLLPVDFGVDGYSSSIAIQSNDKIIVGGYSYNGTDGDFKLVRFNTDGSLDNTFDADGTQTIDFGGTQDSLTSIVLQSDGKIVASGYASNGGNIDFATARLNADGSLDNTFNTNGKQTTDFGSTNDYANSVAIQGDGKLIVLGYTIKGANTFIAAARYNQDGTPDISFNGDGLLVPLIQQGDTRYTCTTTQADGKILAAGYTWDGAKYNFAIVRYNTNGVPDNTFSDDGKQTTEFNSFESKANAIAIQSDGKILVAGSVGSNSGIVRYNTDGSLDNTFDNDGMLTTDFGASEGVSMVIQPDGKILIGGNALARYNTDGSPDLSFDGDGKMATPFHNGAPFRCNSIAVQPDGKIIISGPDNGQDEFIVARYNMDGSVDNTFVDNIFNIVGEKHIVSADDPATIRGKSLAIQNDGKIVVGGYSEMNYKSAYSSFILTRLNTDGSFDLTFNGGNVAYNHATVLSYGTSVLIESDNKILLGGYSYDGSSQNFTILRYTQDGILDNTFGAAGIEITQASTAYDRIYGMALNGDNLYAAGFGQYPGNLGVVAKYNLASGGPLPVTLTDFTAELKNKSILLQWQTASEHNLSTFIIERSANGVNFSPIGSVAATGNSNTKISYSTFDYQPLNGANFYRLRIVNEDGKFKYSKVVEATIDRLFSLQIFPNPARDILFVQASGDNEKAAFQIMDVTGKKLKQGEITLQENTSFSIPINNLSNGIYILQLNTREGIETRKFVKK